MEAFHFFLNIVFPVEKVWLLVGQRVVAFAVDVVDERADLRECLNQMAQQAFSGFLVFVVEDNNQHYVAGLGRTDDDVAQESALFTEIVKVEVVLNTVFLYFKTDLVRQLRLKVAVLNVEECGSRGHSCRRNFLRC